MLPHVLTSRRGAHGVEYSNHITNVGKASMDFRDQVRQLGERVARVKDNVRTEEPTKNALIMPFLQAMGYEVFNPLEIVPEHLTDVGTKQAPRGQPRSA